MPRLIHRRQLLWLGAGLGLASALPAARACEFYGRTLRITHPWTRASGHGADAAIVCMKFDEVTEDDRLIAASCPVASGAELGIAGRRAELDIPIPQGQETLLEESGMHLRLVGLAFPLEVARSYPLKLVFERAGVVDTTLSVDYARFR